MAEITKANPEEYTANSQPLKDEQMAQVDGGYVDRSWKDWETNENLKRFVNDGSADTIADPTPIPSPPSNLI